MRSASGATWMSSWFPEPLERSRVLIGVLHSRRDIAGPDNSFGVLKENLKRLLKNDLLVWAFSIAWFCCEAPAPSVTDTIIQRVCVFGARIELVPNVTVRLKFLRLALPVEHRPVTN